MQELLDEIDKLYKEMEELTKAAGVSNSIYDKVIKADKNLTGDELEDRLIFLRGIYKNEYHGVHYTYNLVKPETWAMYKLLGEINRPEQLELRRKQRLLKKAWLNKYGRTHKNSDWQLVESEQDRPEESPPAA